MKLDVTSSGLTKKERDMAELEELIELYKDGTIPYDEEDVKVLEDKLKFMKDRQEAVYNFMMQPSLRKIFFRISSFIGWLYRLMKRFKKA